MLVIWLFVPSDISDTAATTVASAATTGATAEKAATVYPICSAELSAEPSPAISTTTDGTS